MYAIRSYYGIFVGWGAYKRNPFLEELAVAHGGKYIEPNNKAAKFHDLITARGKKASLDFFETGWEERYTMEKALDYAVNHLKRDGITVITSYSIHYTKLYDTPISPPRRSTRPPISP